MGSILHRLRTVTKAVGAKLVIDMTQATGAVQISVRKWNADLLVCSGYKWLTGHVDIAFTIFSDALFKNCLPSIGWFGGEDPFDMNAKQL